MIFSLTTNGGHTSATVADQGCLQPHPSLSIHFDMPRYDCNENNSFELDQKAFTQLITNDDILKAYKLNIKSCALKAHPCK